MLRVCVVLFGCLLFSFGALSEAACDSGERFRLDRQQGTVEDSSTGLVWMVCPLGMQWEGKQKTCHGLPSHFDWYSARSQPGLINTSGSNQWRLPKVEELHTLVAPTCFNPAMNPVDFPGTPATGFWSHTPSVDFEGVAWMVHFYNGGKYISDKGQSWLGRLVH